MLLEILSYYLTNVEAVLKSLKDCYIEKYEEEILTPNRVNLRVRIRFSRGYLLELNEAVTVDKGHIKHFSYRYHFQNRDNTLIFRYDNTPHFPDLTNFPHHKHNPAPVVGTEKPLIAEVVEEVKKYLAT